MEGVGLYKREQRWTRHQLTGSTRLCDCHVKWAVRKSTWKEIRKSGLIYSVEGIMKNMACVWKEPTRRVHALKSVGKSTSLGRNKDNQT